MTDRDMMTAVPPQPAEALRFSAEIVAAAPVGMFAYDAAGQCVSANDGGAAIIGATREQVLAQNFRRLESWKQSGLLEDAEQTLATGEPSRRAVHFVTTFGREVWLDYLISRFVSHGRPHLLLVFSDISGQKRLEAQLRETIAQTREINHKLEQAQLHLIQSEKMASLGQLAAGVAHEINNPIGFVGSNLGSLAAYVDSLIKALDAHEALVRSLPPGLGQERVQDLCHDLDLDYLRQDIRALLDESRDGIERVKQIVQNLKDFSRVDDNAQWRQADLHQGLDSTLRIVWNELKYKATVVRNYGGLPEVECLPSQLNQVFMNLLVNAAHAIVDKGDITISTGTVTDQVWVKIADTGSGIAPENLQRIFDPFFTTKPAGKGTGLGLSLVYGIVQKHKGRIEVESEVGKGTAFTVWLPVKQP